MIKEGIKEELREFEIKVLGIEAENEREVLKQTEEMARKTIEEIKKIRNRINRTRNKQNNKNNNRKRIRRT